MGPAAQLSAEPVPEMLPGVFGIRARRIFGIVLTGPPMNTETIAASDVHFQLGRMDEAVALIKKYHYSHRPPSAVELVGTFHAGGGLFGDMGPAIAAVFFSQPTAKWSERVLELSRLVRHDDCRLPLTRLISLACKYLKKRSAIDLLISYADATAGHHGGVYQACSWNYAGQRDARNDGLMIHGQFIPGRTCNALYGTRSASKLRELNPNWAIEPHYDKGKHLYWRALAKTGEAKAGQLGLERLPYPKPDISPKTPLTRPPTIGYNSRQNGTEAR